ncbi:MAG: recombinase family protein [Pseudonocardiaceae bacterium]
MPRSVKDFAGLLERAQRRAWRVVLLDLGDTSSATGELTTNMIASAAPHERRLIGQRTREGQAAKRAAGFGSAPRPCCTSTWWCASCANAKPGPRSA